jgi:dTDP-4-amino-4,6-dideoxygalactose transaminase
VIDFNIPAFIGTELNYIKEAVDSHKICGDGMFTHKCNQWLEEKFKVNHALLTTSCTHALEMAGILSEISPGDEVIMPSYTFVSTANAFLLRGAKLVFVDIRPETMNIDERLIEAAITERTKAIVPVHYAGVACAMDEIMDIAKRHQLAVIEDAAQGVSAFYKGKALGTIGDFGCYSFHETKNYSMGEGGAIIFNLDNMKEKAEILREKGTNRSQFFRGQIDKYTWVDYGSSYLPSELNAAYLWAQLEEADEINDNRLSTYAYYDKELEGLAQAGLIEQPFVPEYAVHNAHMYFIKAENLEVRTQLIEYLKSYGVQSVFHYIPLHSSPAGRKFGRFCGEDRYTTKESERLLRLPMYYNISDEDREKVVQGVIAFYRDHYGY